MPLIVPILATPFGVVPLLDVQHLNPALEVIFDARMRAAGPTQPDILCYRSGEDLFEASESALSQLAGSMLRGVCSIVSGLNQFSEQTLKSLRVEARGWFTVVLPDGHVAATNHALTAWCAVYCVAAPGPSATRADSGVLRLYESRFGTSFQDASNADMHMPYKVGHYGWRPVPGQMAVFPGSLPYEIALLRATERLVLVTARVRFVAPGQQGMGRW